MQERTTREEAETHVLSCWECGDDCEELTQAPWSTQRMLVCAGCLELSEPDCECHQTDVDLFDAFDCPVHDPNSPWNVRLRAVTAVQMYEQMEGEVA
jgi:hypothetical protein